MATMVPRSEKARDQNAGLAAYPTYLPNPEQEQEDVSGHESEIADDGGG